MASMKTRSRVSATVDAGLLHAVDAYVALHPETDRSKVIDEALWLWCKREQDRALEAQFSDGPDVPPDEYEAWRSIRRAATERALQREPID